MATLLPDDPVLGLAELSKVLDRSVGALRVARARGRLPILSHRIGNTLVFSRADVESFKRSYIGKRGPAKTTPNKPAKSTPKGRSHV